MDIVLKHNPSTYMGEEVFFLLLLFCFVLLCFFFEHLNIFMYTKYFICEELREPFSQIA